MVGIQTPPLNKTTIPSYINPPISAYVFFLPIPFPIIVREEEAIQRVILFWAVASESGWVPLEFDFRKESETAVVKSKKNHILKGHSLPYQFVLFFYF